MVRGGRGRESDRGADRADPPGPAPPAAGDGTTEKGAEMRKQLRLVRDAFEKMPLGDDIRVQASAALGEVEKEVALPEPEPARVAVRIEQFTNVLKAGGALAAAGLSLMTPLQAIGIALGPLGRTLLGLLR